MSTISDMKFAALQAAGHTGNITEMWFQWLAASSGAANPQTLGDALDAFLTDKGITAGTVSDRWFAYMGTQGHTEPARADRELAFWTALAP